MEWGRLVSDGFRWYLDESKRFNSGRFVCLWTNLGSGYEHLDPCWPGLVPYLRAAVFQLGFQIAHNDFSEAPGGHVARWGSVAYLFGLQGLPMLFLVFRDFFGNLWISLVNFSNFGNILGYPWDFVACRRARHRTTICTWLCFWGADLLKPTHLVSNMKRPGESAGNRKE